MKIKKQQILAGSLILALGAAVYLNWQFSGAQQFGSVSKELGAAAYVSNDIDATADEAAQTSQSAQITPEQKLAQARTERTKAQDKALEAAENILKLTDSSDEAKEEAVKAANDIEQRILAQSNIEGILSAKGYPSALCYISDSGCTLTLLSSELNEDAPMIIKETVISQSQAEFNDIVIVDIQDRE